YYKLSDFISDWTYESESTIKVFSNLTDEVLAKKVHEKVRTAGRIAWHITTSIPEMMNRTGLKIETVKEDAPIPNTVGELVSAYKSVSEALITQVKANWNDESLLKEDDMYGEMWAKGKTLGVLVTHQIHHRAQLTVVMRLAGLKVPGVYGPSNEEWVEYGMPAHE
ncbi:MAG: DinB family protein, partial [Ignavibacteriales bacterium]|nr:DinB family protein [Ignavibacteriales bacterium]